MPTRADDKRLRATLVLLGALLVEVYWLKFTVVPEFVEMYRDYGAELPALTMFVFGWGPYAIALGLAPLALMFAWRGAAAQDRRHGTAGVVLAAMLVAGLGVGVIWALYAPIYALAGQVR